jgi:hypothetical protein
MKPASTPTNILLLRGQTPSPSITLSPPLPAFTAAFAIVLFVSNSPAKINVTTTVFCVAILIMSVSFYTGPGVLAVSGACMALTVLSFIIMRAKDYDDTSVGRCVVALSANIIMFFLPASVQWNSIQALGHLTFFESPLCERSSVKSTTGFEPRHRS